MIKEYNFEGKAMGTSFHLSLISPEEALALSVFSRISEEIAAHEQRFSRFLPESELSLLNKEKEIQPSPQFQEVLTIAIALTKETSGYFNPLLSIASHGYDTTYDNLHSKEHGNIQEREGGNIDILGITIHEGTGVVSIKENQKLDFGGILKGYVAERLAKSAMEGSEHLTGIILNIGGDLATYGKDAKGNTFIFTIYNPITDKEEGNIPLENTCLATSGSYKRTWESHGRQIHHILDPMGKQNPTSDIISATVIHTNGAKAEAYAKMLFSLGDPFVQRFFEDKGISYATITKEGVLRTHLPS